ncbi:MAG: LysR family transcriptional regulator [Bacteroidota bacterium]
MDYTLHQLKVFTTIAEMRSITKAAEALYLTQPAVSIQLKSFQSQFEIPLTEVVGRKLHITEFGEEIVEASKKILLEVENMNHKLLAYQGQVAGKLKISVVSTGKYIMPSFLSDFLKKHPAVELRMDVTNKVEVVNSLEENTVDFSLVSIRPERLSLESIPLMENQLFLVGSRFAERSPSDIHPRSILRETPLILREPGSGTRQTIERYLAQHQLPLRTNMELTSNEAVKQAVLADLGYAILPLIGIKNELELGQLKIIPISDFPISSQWQLIWLKGKKFGPAARTYLQYLRKHKDQIIQQRYSWFEQYRWGPDK